MVAAPSWLPEIEEMQSSDTFLLESGREVVLGDVVLQLRIPSGAQKVLGAVGDTGQGGAGVVDRLRSVIREEAGFRVLLRMWIRNPLSVKVSLL